MIWISRLGQMQAPTEAKHAAYQKKLAEYHVVCAETGEQIQLSELKYWNVERQEPYKDAEAGLKAHTRHCA